MVGIATLALCSQNIQGRRGRDQSYSLSNLLDSNFPSRVALFSLLDARLVFVHNVLKLVHLYLGVIN